MSTFSEFYTRFEVSTRFVLIRGVMFLVFDRHRKSRPSNYDKSEHRSASAVHVDTHVDMYYIWLSLNGEMKYDMPVNH